MFHKPICNCPCDCAEWMYNGLDSEGEYTNEGDPEAAE
jgi:hypothetical protein